MFDLDASKIVIVGVAALIFIPPKDLPRVMRQVGQFVGKMKRMAGEFQGQFMDAMREADMADLRKEARELSEATRIDVGLNSVHDIDNQMKPLSAPSPHERRASAMPSFPPGMPSAAETSTPSGQSEPPSPAPAAPVPEPQHTS